MPEKTASNKIAPAHNNNDKVETILMNILRGSGTSGLKGIEAIRDKKFIRPLIETSREEIEEYCEVNKLNPRIDKSNNENIYTRNKVRNVVSPYIKQEFNPNILKTINRLSEVATEESEYLNRITKQTFNKINVGAHDCAQQNKNENKCVANVVGVGPVSTRQNQNDTKHIANTVGVDAHIDPHNTTQTAKDVGESIARPHFEGVTQENQIVLDLKQFNNLELLMNF